MRFTNALPSKWDDRFRRLMIANDWLRRRDMCVYVCESWNWKCFSTSYNIILLLSCHLTSQLRKIVFALIDLERWISMSFSWVEITSETQKIKREMWGKKTLACYMKMFGGCTVWNASCKSRHSYFQTCLTRACRFPLSRSCRAIRTDLHGLTTDRLALSFNCRFIRNVASELNSH